MSAGPNNRSGYLKLALYLISSGLQGIDARIANTLHCEVIIRARDGIAGQVAAIVKRAMEEAFKRIIPEIPFAVEIRVAEAWECDLKDFLLLLRESHIP